MLVVKKCVGESVNTKFLGSQTDNHINWRNHTEQIIPNVSAAYYAVSSTVHISNFNTVVPITVNTFTVIKCGLFFFCGNSSNSREVFILQKKIVRIVAGAEL